MKTFPKGAYPAMITPFKEDGAIDYPAVGELLRWYERMNCSGVLALCASSETEKLSLDERVELAKYIVAHKGKLVIIASGHVSDSVEDQLTELNAMADAGVDGLCLIVGRLNQHNETEDEFIENIKVIMDGINNKEIPLGFYEKPCPENRSLSEKIIKFCADTGRFAFMKETSCDPDVIAAKIRAAAGSPFGIYNANSVLLYDSLKAGAAGFCGIMGNFHPDLYQWLCVNHEKYPAEAKRLADYISAIGETGDQYPASAKYHQNLYGAKMSTYLRRTGDAPVMKPAVAARLQRVESVVNELRAWLASL